VYVSTEGPDQNDHEVLRVQVRQGDTVMSTIRNAMEENQMQVRANRLAATRPRPRRLPKAEPLTSCFSFLHRRWCAYDGARMPPRWRWAARRLYKTPMLSADLTAHAPCVL